MRNGRKVRNNKPLDSLEVPRTRGHVLLSHGVSREPVASFRNERTQVIGLQVEDDLPRIRGNHPKIEKAPRSYDIPLRLLGYHHLSAGGRTPNGTPEASRDVMFRSYLYLRLLLTPDTRASSQPFVPLHERQLPSKTRKDHTPTPVPSYSLYRSITSSITRKFPLIAH